MNLRFLAPGIDPAPRSARITNPRKSLLVALAVSVPVTLLTAASLGAQVLTIDTSGNGPVAGNGPVDRQYRQVEPTHVELSKTVLDPKTRLMLIRDLMSEQGFAMRPFPRGHKGLTLEANGKLDPAGVGFLNMVINEGLSAKPGARVVVTDIKIDRSKIVLDLNGGPDAAHRFLRHIQIGAGPDMDDPEVDPILLDQQGDPAGSRMTLAFPKYVPELTPAQVNALLAPLISFDVKTPIQAFTDTLPPALKNAILNHEVWVGMSTDMVLFAKGRPNEKSREMDGQMPFEVWIYGTPPQEVDFVRINGNRVIRVEIAKDAQPLEVFTKDVVTPLLMSSGSPELAAETNTRTIKEGDVERDPDKEAPAPPPTLRDPGETLPTDNQSVGVMRPVQFPKDHPNDIPGADPDEQSSAPPSSGPTPQTSNGQTSSQPGNAQPSSKNSQSQPASSSQPKSAPANPAPPTNDSQQPPPGSNQLVSAGATGTETN
jgi:hypothetical protein